MAAAVRYWLILVGEMTENYENFGFITTEEAVSWCQEHNALIKFFPKDKDGLTCKVSVIGWPAVEGRCFTSVVQELMKHS